MFTDIVGYTSMAQRDEAHALVLLDEHRALLEPLFASRHGRVVKTIGDAFLVEFPSSLEAVECAVEAQRTIASSRSKDSDFRIRIGIHLGDVVENKGDIYGDAVNVASRVQELADPGGICVSEQVYQSVLNKTSFEFESLGKQKMKNVESPVRAYKVTPAASDRPSKAKEGAPGRDRVAVLPLADISDGGGDAYFADGLTEELISALSSVRGLKLIARTSVMAYRNSSKTASEIGAELGVGILVEGSVRRAGNRVRVAVQLVDSSTQERLWGGTYDRELGDIFAVQSDIAARVAEVLPGHLTSDQGIVKPISPRAYDTYLQARELIHERSPEAVPKAVNLLKTAIALEPEFASAYVSLANCYVDMGMLNIAPYEVIKDARRAAEKALQLEPDLADAHAILGFICWVEDDLQTAEREARRAVELNPSMSNGYESLATVQASTGRIEEAIKNQELAHQLDPLSKRIAWYLSEYYLYAGRRGEAIELWRKLKGRYPLLAHQGHALDAVVSGDLERAGEHLVKMEELGHDDTKTLLLKGMVAGMRGDRATAEKVIQEVESNFGEGAVTINLVGFVRYSMGDVDGFFDCMLRAADAHVLWAVQLRYSPIFAKVRDDPRMKEAFRRGNSTIDAD
jgi:adenylate cyclase